MSAPTYVIAIDFEAFGGITPIHGFSQLGAVLYDVQGDRVISCFNMCANQEGFVMEQRCIDDFWSRFPDLFEQLKLKCADSKRSCYEVIDEFWKWVDDSMKALPVGADVIAIGDNVAFDYGVLRFFSKKDVAYAFGGTYKDIIDLGSYYYGLNKEMANYATTDGKSSKDCALKAVYAEEFPSFDVKHDHNAVNDAETMARRFGYIQRRMNLAISL